MLTHCEHRLADKQQSAWSTFTTCWPS